MVLQPVADAHYRFVVIDVGGCGKQNGGSTFASPDLLKSTRSLTFLIQHLYQEHVPMHHIPLLKPYAKYNPGFIVEMYNIQLSRMRKSIGCAFGALFAKWSSLSTIIETGVEVLKYMIESICVLHNIIIGKERVPHNLSEAVL